MASSGSSHSAPYSIITLNAWNTEQWATRRAIVVDFFKTFRPDILCLQEVRPEVLDAVREALVGFEYLQDASVPGYLVEGNILWNASKFDKLAIGAEDVGIEETERRLFWVLLREREKSPTEASDPQGGSSMLNTAGVSRSSTTPSRKTSSGITGSAGMNIVPGGAGAGTHGTTSGNNNFSLEHGCNTLLVCTAHLTWQGSYPYLTSNTDPRKKQMRRICEWLEVQAMMDALLLGHHGDPTGRRGGTSEQQADGAISTNRQLVDNDIESHLTSPRLAGDLSSSAELVGPTSKQSSSRTPSVSPVLLQQTVAHQTAGNAGSSSSSAGPFSTTPLAPPALIFCGDLNCAFGPKQVLRQALPFMQDCFSGLQLRIPSTHPARPSDPCEEQLPDQTLDWIFYDQRNLAPVMATKLEKLYEGSVRHVSDHFPLWFSFRFVPGLDKPANYEENKDWVGGDPFFSTLTKYAPPELMV
ncbi:unnamed protein product [Amoebophrya sp. A120]|nr:unnamed protein product [Amoebophrya sp. A120]|eukprot:GSA120T00011346001.1